MQHAQRAGLLQIIYLGESVVALGTTPLGDSALALQAHACVGAR